MKSKKVKKIRKTYRVTLEFPESLTKKEALLTLRYQVSSLMNEFSKDDPRSSIIVTGVSPMDVPKRRKLKSLAEVAGTQTGKEHYDEDIHG